MDFIFIINILFGALCLVYFYFIKKNQYWEERNVPFVKPEIFYGNTRGVGEEFHPSEMMRRLYTKLKQFGTIIGGIYLYTIPSAMALNLDFIKTILIKDFKSFTNKGGYSNESDDPLSGNLINLEDEPWRKLRHNLTPTFSSGKIKMMFDTIEEKAEKLVSQIQKESASTGQLEVKEILSRYTTDVIGSIGFGIECNALEDKNSKFYVLSFKAFKTFKFFKRILLQSYRDIARKLHVTTTSQEISDFYFHVIEENIKYRKENTDIKRNDFMKLLIDLKDAGVITYNRLVAQSSFFFLAAYETSQTALSFCMYELAVNKNIQEKLRESIEDALEQHEGKLTYKSLNEMNYLDQCVKETLRKYPPASNIQRIANENYHVANTKYVIEKGTPVTIPIYSIHHDPENYPNPEKYDPERFTQEEVQKRHPLSWIPFGGGPRMCIGRRFAIVEIKIALVNILRNFKFELDRSKTAVPLKIATKKMLLSPAEGIYVNFTKLEA